MKTKCITSLRQKSLYKDLLAAAKLVLSCPANSEYKTLLKDAVDKLEDLVI